eukprot:scaffold1403_cov241-Pinguiococcus_pyrenoidosus.AAC.8
MRRSRLIATALPGFLHQQRRLVPRQQMATRPSGAPALPNALDDCLCRTSFSSCLCPASQRVTAGEVVFGFCHTWHESICHRQALPLRSSAIPRALFETPRVRAARSLCKAEAFFEVLWHSLRDIES